MILEKKNQITIQSGPPVTEMVTTRSVEPKIKQNYYSFEFRNKIAKSTNS